MTFFPGGFPGGYPGGTPGGFPGSFPGGTTGSFPGGFPGPGRFPGGTPGGFPGFPSTPSQPSNRPPNPSGSVTPPPPSQQTINQFQYLSQHPTQAQSMLLQQHGSQGGVTRFAAGCDGRWTTILLRNGQLFLMYVLSSNVTGNTTGIIWPNYTFGSFPSSAIAAYSCY